MSTIDFIGVETKKNISEFQALAVTVMNAPASVEADAQALYNAALEQPTVVVTDQTLPKGALTMRKYWSISQVKMFRPPAGQ